MDVENIDVENEVHDGEIVYNEPPEEPTAPEELGLDSVEGTPEEYEPNFTYKIKDEEHQFDEMFNPFVNDKQSEEALRDLYTKAGGLDSYKEKVTSYEERLGERDSEITGLRDGFKQLRGFRDEGKYRQLFSSIGLSDDDVMKYSLSVAQEEELPEEQREIIKQNREYKDRLDALESNMSRQAQLDSSRSTERDLDELSSHVNTHSDLNKTMAAAGYDLSDEIIAYGLSAGRMNNGKEPTLTQATEAVVKKYNSFLNHGREAQPATNTIEQRINNRPKTLPRVNSSNQTAPMDAPFSSIDQLRELSKQFS